MKKIKMLPLFGALALMMSLLTACGGNAVTNGGAASNASQVADSTSGGTQSANNSSVITEEKAKQIALNDAGLAERNLTDLRIWLENDDRRQEYHVEFRQDNIVYEYEIDAVSGIIRAFDRDDETATGNNTAGESNAISVADAKQTALKHAGFSEADVTRLEARLEKDDGRDIYDVEFYKDRTEYDYAIDANTGKILSYHIDAD